MAFTIFQFDTGIYRSEVMDNFYHIGDGDMLPIGDSGNMGTTDGAYNLGSSDEQWNECHVQNIALASGGGFERTWQLISEVELDDTATAIEFTNLNGDSEEMYNIIAKGVNNLSTGGYKYMTFNDDSGTNYGYQTRYAFGSSRAALRLSSLTALPFLYYGATRTSLSFNETYIYAKSGKERTALSDITLNAYGTYVNFISHWGFIWSDKTNNITSMKMIIDSRTGTAIQLWAPNFNSGVANTTT